MVEQAIEQRRGDDGVCRRYRPILGEAAVRKSELWRRALYRASTSLKDQIAAPGDHGQVTDFVDDQQLRLGTGSGGVRGSGGSRSALASELTMLARVAK